MRRSSGSLSVRPGWTSTRRAAPPTSQRSRIPSRFPLFATDRAHASRSGCGLVRCPPERAARDGGLVGDAKRTPVYRRSVDRRCRIAYHSPPRKGPPSRRCTDERAMFVPSGHHARPVRLPPSQQAPSLEELRIWRPVGIDQGAYCRIRYRIGRSTHAMLWNRCDGARSESFRPLQAALPQRGRGASFSRSRRHSTTGISEHGSLPVRTWWSCSPTVKTSRWDPTPAARGSRPR
jgi:hypothetical protein